MPDHVPLAVEELTLPPEQPVLRREIGAPPWEIYYLAVYLVCGAIVEFGPLSPAQRILASIALGLLLPWYVLIGRPVMVLDETDWERAQHSWRGPVYLTGAIVLLAVVQIQDNNRCW